MLVEWKNELLSLENEQLNYFCDFLCSLTGISLNDLGKSSVRKWIKQFGFSEVIESCQISVDQYFDTDNFSGTKNKTFDYIPRICNVRKRQETDPSIKDRNQIKYLINNKFKMYNQQRVSIFLNAVVLEKTSAENVKELVDSSRNWSDFWHNVNQEYGGGW